MSTNPTIMNSAYTSQILLNVDTQPAYARILAVKESRQTAIIIKNTELCAAN